MNTTRRLEPRHTQSQTLTPRLQLAVRLLQLSSLDYAQELNAALARNPFLESDDEHGDPAANDGVVMAMPRQAVDDSPGDAAGDGAHDADGAPAPATFADTCSALADFDGSAPAASDSNGDAGLVDSPRDSGLDGWSISGGSGTSDGETSAVDLAPVCVGLREHLLFQANVLRLGERDRMLLRALIESLDDDGYLRIGLDEVAKLAGLEPPARAADTTTALRLLQSFEPAGVGATSLSECLLLQWRQAEMDEADRALGEDILSHHLEALGRHDAADLARRCHGEATDVDRVCHAIRLLDPRPGQAYAADEARYITPDVIVRKSHGQWAAQLNPAAVPRLRLNQRYAQLFQRHRDARHRELAGHLQDARWTLRNIEQRFSTILDVANAILRRQYRFLDMGVFAMKPLMLRDIADDCGLHQSTICRVTNNKYMATPCGVFELKYFFSRAMPLRSGGACSPTAIRGLIRDLVEAEPPTAPLSDVDIAKLLSRQGVQVARRTVTKYRQMLKLPAVERRRQLAHS